MIAGRALSMTYDGVRWITSREILLKICSHVGCVRTEDNATDWT